MRHRSRPAPGDPSMSCIRVYLDAKNRLWEDRQKDPWRAAFWAGAATFIVVGGAQLLLRWLLQ